MSSTTIWVTLKEGAAQARCSTVTLRRAIRSGHLTAYKLGGRRAWRLKAADVDQWLAGGHGDEPALHVIPRAEHGQGGTR